MGRKAMPSEASGNKVLDVKNTAMSMAVLAALCLVLSACGKTGAVTETKGDAAGAQPAAADSKAAPKAGLKADGEDDKAGEGDKDKEGVTLTPEQLEKLGVTTQPAQAIDYREESIGYRSEEHTSELQSRP